jgi:hypothetical protein
LHFKRCPFSFGDLLTLVLYNFVLYNLGVSILAGKSSESGGVHWRLMVPSQYFKAAGTMQHIYRKRMGWLRGGGEPPDD